MSNIQTARQALKAELQHAKDGVAYYMSRVALLESALERIDVVEVPAGGTKGKAAKSKGNGKVASSKRGRKPKATAGATPSVEASTPANGRAELPKTGSDFWLNYISAQPQGAAEIAKAAAAGIGLNPKKDIKQISVLKQRVGPALKQLVETNKVKDSGTGRERRYFKE